jgi:uncharacterized protein (TIGR02996 family)
VDEKEAMLLAAIEADPADQGARDAYTDYLREQKQSEKAAVVMGLSTAELASRAWLTRFASRLRDDEWDDELKKLVPGPGPGWSYDRLVKRLTEYVLSGRMLHLSFETPDFVFGEREEMWRHFYVVTGQKPPADDEVFGQNDYPFSCAC